MKTNPTTKPRFHVVRVHCDGGTSYVLGAFDNAELAYQRCDHGDSRGVLRSSRESCPECGGITHHMTRCDLGANSEYRESPFKPSLPLFKGLPPIRECSKSKAEAVFADPCASHWLKSALMSATTRDAVDALSDAETLVAILKQRAQEGA